MRWCIRTAQFKDAVLTSAHKSYAYVFMDVLHRQTKYPDCLARGDISQNLRDFAEGDLEVVRAWEPDDMTWSIRCLLFVHYPRGLLEDALKLYRDKPGTVHLTENAHGSGAEIARQHSKHGECTYKQYNNIVYLMIIWTYTHLYMESTMDYFHGTFHGNFHELFPWCHKKYHGLFPWYFKRLFIISCRACAAKTLKRHMSTYTIICIYVYIYMYYIYVYVGTCT